MFLLFECLARAGDHLLCFFNMSFCPGKNQVRGKESHFSEADFLAPSIGGDAETGWDGPTTMALVA